jgi:hypothetical protein
VNAATGQQVVKGTGKQEGDDDGPNRGRSKSDHGRTCDGGGQYACYQGKKHEAFVSFRHRPQQDRGR